MTPRAMATINSVLRFTYFHSIPGTDVLLCVKTDFLRSFRRPLLLRIEGSRPKFRSQIEGQGLFTLQKVFRQSTGASCDRYDASTAPHES